VKPAVRLAVAVWIVAAVKLLAHLATTGRFGYEYFVDELYFDACARHLAWGYIDMPPLHPALTALVRATLGDSLFAIRLLPALAGAALVLLTGLLARDLGGGRGAQFLGAIAVAVAPIFLATHSFSSMNAWEPLIWTGCAILLVRLLDGADPRLWLAFGLLAGIGLLNKHTMGLLGAAVVAGLVATGRGRALFRSRWIWIGAAAAFFVFLPNLAWNIREGFPFFELQQAIRDDGRNVELSPFAFLGQQVLFLNPLSAPLWLGGLAWLLFDRSGRHYRCLGIAYLVVFGALLALDGRVYYLAPAYPMLFAAGGVGAEGLFSPRRLAWLRPAYAALLVAAGLLLAPMAFPLLPPETYVRYSRALGLQPPAIETHRMGPLPQLLADRFGWKEMAAEAARIYHALPAGERGGARVFGQNYGQAGAIDMYGPALGLPPALSGHLAYHDWGPPAAEPIVLIVLDDDRGTLESLFESVEFGGRVGHPYSMPYQHFDVWVCRRPRVPLRELWPRLRQLG
jgi:4-amino-4-deoxy-L-arabinose transferase-like glycosyltransferase